MVYRIQKSGKAKPKYVHIDRLNPYEGSAECDWLHKQEPNRSLEHPKDEATADVPHKTKDGHKQKDGSDCNAKPKEAGPQTSCDRPRRSRRPPAWTTDYQMNTQD